MGTNSVSSGLVVKNTGSSYLVRTDAGEYVECKIKGNFRIKSIRTTNPVAVGDVVRFELNPDGSAWIYEIQDRKNYIIRRASNLSKQAHIIAANVDLAALIVTVNYPETSLVFIDRFLITAEAYRVPACLIFNKTDCYSEDERAYLEQMRVLYEMLGYKTFAVSALYDANQDELKAYFSGKTVLLSGNSGVGKSTLLNNLMAKELAKTGEISVAHNKGMHTTTFSEMYELAQGTWLIDTPGIKGFGTVDMKKEEVGHYFKEIFAISSGCRFNNCTHIHEPGCAVLEAVGQHRIASSRYQSYLSILEDMDEGKYR